MSQLNRRIARLEGATGGAIDIAAELSKRLSLMRRARHDPELAAELARKREEWLQRMKREYDAGQREGIAMRLYVATIRSEAQLCR